MLGEELGKAFNAHFGITRAGNFEGKSVPNLLSCGDWESERLDPFLPKIQEYRRQRTKLHRDEKVLTLWNALAISAFSALYKISRREEYRETAKGIGRFLEEKLWDKGRLFTSYCRGRRGAPGFLADYAGYACALLSLYTVTWKPELLDRARQVVDRAIEAFFDEARGGFYLYDRTQEELLFCPKETFDGAIPSGNSLMAAALVRLNALLPEAGLEGVLKKQLAFLAGEHRQDPAGGALFLWALSDFLHPPLLLTVIAGGEPLEELLLSLPAGSVVRLLPQETAEYRQKNGETTFYPCCGHRCLPPMNQREFLAFLQEETAKKS